MPISVSPSGIQMNDGNTLSLAQSAGVLPDVIVGTGSLLTVKGNITFDGDNGITTSADPTFRLAKGDNVYTNYAVINSTSSWTVPPNVDKGLVVVIGGGGSGGFGIRTGGDTPVNRNGGSGSFGGAGASIIPLVAGNSMPAVVGSATGTSSFFGIVATGGTNGTSATPTAPGVPGTPGTASNGTISNGSVATFASIIDFIDNNDYPILSTVTPALQSLLYTNPSAGYAAGTLYNITNIYSAGSAGTAGIGSPIVPTPPGAGLPGTVIIFY